MEYKIIKLVVGDLQENCFILFDENKDAFIVDPGDSSKNIINVIEKNNLSIKFILLTHGHFDHVGAVAALKEKYNVPIYLSEKDKNFLEKPEEVRASAFGIQIEPAKVDYFVKDKDEIKFSQDIIKVIETPGHTIGSVCYLFKNLLFSGDTLFNGSIGRTDFPESDHNLMMESLKKLKNLDDDIFVLSGHGPESQMNYEKNSNPYFRRL
ncbi:MULTISPECIES: MBL fold metallo-hydrolase [Peptoniphilus]|jgi:metallo-beta-lactamase family protein|uniref:MBL fold metallo-hydrolase n=2 Tax=Peptoniphilaceae TaxID=1570339 RepID=UPI0002887021|nr:MULTISPECIES: MBL fold metallo-hydrolase [Peptoniphilus]MBS6610036.1 MBL fold metallo-hydrolase [Peptoniphilus harei]MDU1043473.1 MBL fold metallo-hydrolase [Peptoniphilus rhinitidis]MDU1954188.1 MBL fold metallo-hydrolase [Peptoniphilus lacydonensis]MDU2109884.1 MBL fold metallo-hydrolase [Peptoniphilus lacydonensis]MDU2115547.1 MBL fold metallo-hydrolase [Peptoniphilus lacydonensis]